MRNVASYNPFLMVVFLVSVMMTSCSMSDDEEVRQSDNIVNVGDELPTFTVSMNDGSLLSTSDLRGKPSLIVFFSTTCPDCQRELPGLDKRFLEHGEDTTFVAISREESFADVSAYWETHDLHIPFSAQPDRHVYSLFAKKGIPRVYISDGNCVVQRIVGY